jgi:hypothetical protein
VQEHRKLFGAGTARSSRGGGTEGAGS